MNAKRLFAGSAFYRPFQVVFLDVSSARYKCTKNGNTSSGKNGRRNNETQRTSGQEFSHRIQTKIQSSICMRYVKMSNLLRFVIYNLNNYTRI